MTAAPDETIVAVATPPGTGAVSIVRISGPAVDRLAKRFVRTKSPLRPRIATRATLLDEDGEPLDHGLALLFPRPHSYTGEDLLELQTHGSPVVVREVVRALLGGGARLAGPGEFTRRAFFNGKLGLHEAAAVADLIEAQTRRAARAALANLESGVGGEVREIRAGLKAVVEELEGAIDFPDEVPEPNRVDLAQRIAPLYERLERLRRDGEAGRVLREGLAVAIVGPPNAGKSSLLNALLGTQRAIVSEIPGTTRDTIEELLAIDGVPVRLIDTAGIRSHADRLEASGIARTQAALEAADIALVVIDGSQAPGPDVDRLLERTSQKTRILYLNKADLGTDAALARRHRGAVAGSVREATTVQALREAIAQAGWREASFDATRPHLSALHEFEAVNDALGALRQALESLAAGEPVDFAATELGRAFSALGHVSEPVAAEEIIAGIFSRFCIGK
ncbi:MAG TPA: tRNA uridine-5-carboxymethylaminomethyl(34) synthesis GTPase MnmE [Candidatus Cybelea sp.]